VIAMLEIRWTSWLGVLFVPLIGLFLTRVVFRTRFHITEPVLWGFCIFGWVLMFVYYGMAYFLEWETSRLAKEARNRIIKDEDAKRERPRQRQASFSGSSAKPAKEEAKEHRRPLVSKRHRIVKLIVQSLKLMSAFHGTLWFLSFSRGEYNTHPHVPHHHRPLPPWWGHIILWNILTVIPMIFTTVFIQPFMMNSWSVFSSVFRVRKPLLQATIRQTVQLEDFRREIVSKLASSTSKAKLSRNDAAQIFIAYDKDKSGRLDITELAEMLDAILDVTLTKRQFMALHRALDPNGEGIDQENFFNLLVDGAIDKNAEQDKLELVESAKKLNEMHEDEGSDGFGSSDEERDNDDNKEEYLEGAWEDNEDDDCAFEEEEGI